MIKVSYHILPNSIALSFDGKMFTLQRDDKRYSKVVEAIKSDNLEAIPSLVDTSKLLEGTPFQLVEGVAVIPGEGMLPEALSQRIIALRNEGLPIDPLVKFWEKLKSNPSFNSRAQLYKFLEHNGHPLTTDGNFIAYRGVTEDFKDKHTQKFDNSVGATCEVPRSEVDDNPNNTCSHGLHVACFEYAKDFARNGTLIEVEIDPSDVVTVPTDYNGTKMRVCKFKVVALCEEMRTEPLYQNEQETRDFTTIKNTIDTIKLVGKEHKKWELQQAKDEREQLEEDIANFDTANDDIGFLIELRQDLSDLDSEIERLEGELES